MADRLTFRQTLLQMLAAYYDLSFKEIGARCGMTERNVSHQLRRQRKRDEMKDDVCTAHRCHEHLRVAHVATEDGYAALFEPADVPGRGCEHTHAVAARL